MAVAESSEDKVVDSLIDRMQSTLNQLKAAQQKDVAGEAEEQGEPDEPEPKNLKDAGNNQLSPDEVSWLVQFRQALEQPEIMQQWWDGYAKENGLTVAEAKAQAEDAVDDFGFQDPSQQLEKLLEERLTPLQKQLEQYEGRFAQQDQARQEAEASQYIEGQFSELQKKHGEIDKQTRELIETFAGKYIESDPMNAIPRGYDDLQHLLNSHEKRTLDGKLNQPPPAEGGGVPDVNPPEHKRIDSEGVKNAALEWMRNQNRA
jgi:hypothetical protein